MGQNQLAANMNSDKISGSGIMKRFPVILYVLVCTEEVCNTGNKLLKILIIFTINPII